MNTGKTLFAQFMNVLPWTTLARYVARYGGDKGVSTLTCAEQFRVMAFAQLTDRESRRDIEVCLSVQNAKRYRMDFREPIRCSTLADASHLSIDLDVVLAAADREVSAPAARIAARLVSRLTR